ncbi:MAG TPA: hypothetical protein VI653_00270 [Steroidobacteraceae bacterium]
MGLKPAIPERIAPISGSVSTTVTGFNDEGDLALTVNNDASNVSNTVLWRQGALTVLVNNSIPGAINDEARRSGSCSLPPTHPRAVGCRMFGFRMYCGSRAPGAIASSAA